MEFSVLMSIYKSEKPSNFDEAMQSIWVHQSLRPSQIVLVLDGPLTPELYSCVSKWKEILGKILDIVKLPENLGLGSALNRGLKYCKFSFIARMDTDDISTYERFSEQIKFLLNNPDVDVVGTYIAEMDENGTQTRALVKYPLEHMNLKKMFMKRDPMPHVTVMFRSRFFDKAGPYSGELRMAEDTLLWYRGFKAQCHFANIPMVGVIVRQSHSFYRRRSDIKKTVSLFRFRVKRINKELNYGFMGNFYALCYFLISLSPAVIKKMLYKSLR